MRLKEFQARMSFYGAKPDSYPLSPAIKLHLVRDLYAEQTSRLVECASIVEEVSLARQLVPPGTPLFMWIDARYQLRASSDGKHYQWRLCTTIHENAPTRQRGFLDPRKQLGELVFFIHEIGTDHAQRAIFVFDQMVSSKPCEFRLETDMTELAASKPPTVLLSDNEYFRSTPFVGHRVLGTGVEAVSICLEDKWMFSRERCG